MDGMTQGRVVDVRKIEINKKPYHADDITAVVNKA